MGLLIDPVVVFGKRVVLELKFTGRFPDWWRELVRVFDLERGSAAKYVDGITLYGEQRVRDALRWNVPLEVPEPPAATGDTPAAPAPPSSPPQAQPRSAAVASTADPVVPILP